MPRSNDDGFLETKFVVISNPLKSLVPPPPLFKGQVAPFILVIPLKSFINALSHIFEEVPKLVLMSLIRRGIICLALQISLTFEISPDISIFLTNKLFHLIMLKPKSELVVLFKGTMLPLTLILLALIFCI